MKLSYEINLNNDIDCLSGDRSNPNGIEYDFQKKYVAEHKYNIYERIINICDLMCSNKILSVEKRLIDLIIRHGSYETTQYHVKETIKLKKYFDSLLGYNLYDLFPEIKENL